MFNNYYNEDDLKIDSEIESEVEEIVKDSSIVTEEEELDVSKDLNDVVDSKENVDKSLVIEKKFKGYELKEGFDNYDFGDNDVSFDDTKNRKSNISIAVKYAKKFSKKFSSDTESIQEQNADTKESIDMDNDNLGDTPKIYCANCVNCILLKVPGSSEVNKYQLRVQCSANNWKKKLGDPKIYKFFTVARRIVDECKDYQSMGDHKAYIKDLRKSLPVRDEVYG